MTTIDNGFLCTYVCALAFKTNYFACLETTLTVLSPSEFLNRIWPKKLLTNETLELRLINRKNQKIQREFFHSSSDLLKRAAHSDGMDIYFGVSTRLGNGGKKQDCYRCGVVWADLDNRRISDCEGFNPQPDILVETGGGLHAYWLLKSHILVRDERWLEIEAINRALCKKFGGDIAAIDITRILRVPGTVNTKYTPLKAVRAYAV